VERDVRNLEIPGLEPLPAPKRKGGRQRIHASNAAKLAAYRARHNVKSLTVTLPADLREEFAAWAKAKGRKPSEIIEKTAAVPTPAEAIAIMDKNNAVVVKMKGRYFYGFGKTGQVKTAWSLPGAMMFRAGSRELGKVVESLAGRGRKFEVMVLGVVA
jgi:hypothetical protein